MIAEDERSIANRLANEGKKSEDDAGRASTKGPKTEEEKLAEKDPTAPVCSACLVRRSCQIYLALAVALIRGLGSPCFDLPDQAPVPLNSVPCIPSFPQEGQEFGDDVTNANLL
jgi:hypothetical protein